MKIYLVGGAVRDQLLGLEVKERDWVVVNATPEILKNQGFIPVGKDFPVFLHPKTHEEYALARTEYKVAQGYKGFQCQFDPSVTLEEDLLRRDLTINAIAQDTAGNLIDPYGGQEDIKNRILRHVSAAFQEDPVRILRVARFAARYAHLGFKVAQETLEFMQAMVRNGEVKALTAERIWQEFHKALQEKNPSQFLIILRKCGALNILFPEIDILYGIPNPPHHHPEIDTGIHTELTVEQAARLTSNPIVRFAALVHDLGKAYSPKINWPHHYKHDLNSIIPISTLSKRYKLPRVYQKLALNVGLYHMLCHRALELRPRTILKLFQALDAFRKPKQLEYFLLACEADARGCARLEDRPYPQADYLKKIYQAISQIQFKDLNLSFSLPPESITQAFYKARLDIIKKIKSIYLNIS